VCHRDALVMRGEVSMKHRTWILMAAVGALACSSGGTTSDLGDGGAGSGGLGGSGGSSGGGGSGGGVSPGTTTLVLEIAAGKSYCQSGGCGPISSIAIKDLSGTFIVRSPGDCYTDCDGCQMLPCPGAACQLQGYAVTGETVTWDGTRWLDGTCNGTTQCLARSYAEPGQYVAVMCATPGTLMPDANQVDQCTASGPEECVEVPFEFPSGQSYTGTLGG
jgi:hypothetical protein